MFVTHFHYPFIGCRAVNIAEQVPVGPLSMLQRMVLLSHMVNFCLFVCLFSTKISRVAIPVCSSTTTMGGHGSLPLKHHSKQEISLHLQNSNSYYLQICFTLNYLHVWYIYTCVFMITCIWSYLCTGA